MAGRRRRSRHPVPMALVVVAAAIGLAGCTAATPPPAAPTSITAPSFPAVQGPTLSTSSDDDGPEWHRVVRVGDSEGAYRQARQLLVDGGFILTKDREGTGGGDGQACTTRLCVGFTATDGTDAGPIVAYDWFHPQGIVG